MQLPVLLLHLKVSSASAPIATIFNFKAPRRSWLASTITMLTGSTSSSSTITAWHGTGNDDFYFWAPSKPTSPPTGSGSS
uniref:Putative secreted protein n=1 Tax=Anopheles triannulatus TaxID=58253 RepID=A0A2M4B4P0_9DIPT